MKRVFSSWKVNAGAMLLMGSTGGLYANQLLTNKDIEVKLTKQREEKLQAKYDALKIEHKECQETLENRMDTLNWDDDWDGRAKVKSKARARRLIFLVRHGQYNHGETDEERTLTELGREQARYAGERLKELGFDYNKIVISTMTRAKETGEIISEMFPDVPVEHTDLIREGFPAPPRPPLKGWEVEDDPDHPFEAAQMLEGFKKYIHRADEDAEKGEATVLVCHGNVIRSYVCRALQIPPELWLRLAVDNGSITVISCNSSGSVSLRMHGDVGFMPAEKVTYGSSQFINSLKPPKKKEA